MSKQVTDKAAREAAEGEGLLDERTRALSPARWPGWARARYAGDDPRTSGVVDPLNVDETS